MGDERGLGTHARGRGSRLAAGVASADDNDVIPGAHRLECLHFRAFSSGRTERPLSPVPVVALSVSRETLKAGPCPIGGYELSKLHRFASSVLFADAKIAENHVQNVFYVDPAK